MSDGKVPSSRKKARFSRSKARKRLYAALDLGTNNCRLLIAAPTRNGFRVVDGFSRIVRLGEKLEDTENLSDDAMDRALGALKICAHKLGRSQVRRTWAVATQACRRAQNGQQFVERVRKDTGLNLQIISTEQEASLAVKGCGDLLDTSCEAALVLDIGGGSTELSWVWLNEEKNGISRYKTPHLGDWTSLNMGVVTLSDRFPETNDRQVWFEAMRSYAREQLDMAGGGEAFLETFEKGNVHMVGTSGAVTSLGGLHLDLDRYNRARVDGMWMSDQDTKTATDRLLAQNLEQRATEPCIGKDRADLVLAGCAILQAVLDKWPCARIRVADRGLREGLLLSMMARDRRKRRRR